MRVTVAICTWNRCDLLRQTLEQLTKAIVPPGMALDVLVVNNNCTDDTDDVVAGFVGRLPVRRVSEPNPGHSNARNAAVGATCADYVIFTDDDVLVDEHWLVQFEAAARRFPEAAAIGGVIEPWFPVVPDADLMLAFPALERGFCGLDHGSEPCVLPDDKHLWGANMAYRLSQITQIRFDPDLGFGPGTTVGSEEVELQRRIRREGGVVVWWPRMRVRHYVAPERMSLSYLLRFTAGKGEESVVTGSLSGGSGPLVLDVPRWLYGRIFRALAGYPRGAWIGDAGSHPFSTYSGTPAPSSSRRLRTLVYRRELAFLVGMARGFRRRHRRTQRREALVGQDTANRPESRRGH